MTIIVVQYIIGIIIGIIMMKKIDDRKIFGFKYLIALLILIGLTIVMMMSTSNLRIQDYLLIAYGPFLVSYASGYLYFLIKGTY